MTVKNYIDHVPTYQADQFTGGSDSANAVVLWVTGLGGVASYVPADGDTPESISLQTAAGEMTVTASGYIIYLVDDQVFQYCEAGPFPGLYTEVN